MKFTVTEALNIVEEAFDKKELNVAKDVLSKLSLIYPDDKNVKYLKFKYNITQFAIVEAVNELRSLAIEYLNDPYISDTYIKVLLHLHRIQDLQEYIDLQKGGHQINGYTTIARQILCASPREAIFDTERREVLDLELSKVSGIDDQVRILFREQYVVISSIDFLNYKIEKLSSLGLYSDVLLTISRLGGNNVTEDQFLRPIATCLRHLGNFELALNFINMAIKVQTKNSSMLAEKAKILSHLDKKTDAISLYKMSLLYDPNNEENYFSLGKLYEERSDLERAKEAYEKSLTINQSHAASSLHLSQVYSSLGYPRKAINILKNITSGSQLYGASKIFSARAHCKLGDINAAFEILDQLIAGDCLAMEAFEEKIYVTQQLISYDSINELNFLNNSNAELHPILKIIKIIKNFRALEFEAARDALIGLDECNTNFKLKAKQKKFISNYRVFLERCLSLVPSSNGGNEKFMYHLGDSHSLSFAGHKLQVGDAKMLIKPVTTVGGKAWHIGCNEKNQYQEITRRNLQALPGTSSVFFSFGEIDCRCDEGILKAHRKSGKPISSITRNTVKQYVSWIITQCNKKNHIPYVINLPAPLHMNNFSNEANKKRLEITALFNESLAEMCKKYNVNHIDTYSATIGKLGKSNGLYHGDSYHLDARILPEIEKQLCE